MLLTGFVIPKQVVFGNLPYPIIGEGKLLRFPDLICQDFNEIVQFPCIPSGVEQQGFPFQYLNALLVEVFVFEEGSLYEMLKHR